MAIDRAISYSPNAATDVAATDCASQLPQENNSATATVCSVVPEPGGSLCQGKE